MIIALISDIGVTLTLHTWTMASQMSAALGLWRFMVILQTGLKEGNEIIEKIVQAILT